MSDDEDIQYIKRKRVVHFGALDKEHTYLIHTMHFNKSYIFAINLFFTEIVKKNENINCKQENYRTVAIIMH